MRPRTNERVRNVLRGEEDGGTGDRERESMAVYQHDIQAAVDATSVALDTGTATDTLVCLRDELAKRNIMTSDQEWLISTADAIEHDPDAMIADWPSDFDPARHGDHFA
ncbi:MAG TPA: hypothetical protein VGD39_14350 [Nocardioides sp.]